MEHDDAYEYGCGDDWRSEDECDRRLSDDLTTTNDAGWSEAQSEEEEDFELSEFDEDECDCGECGYCMSKADPFNAYTADGQKCGHLCGCEDWPCCGH